MTPATQMPHPPDRLVGSTQPLNPVDHVMRSADATIRQMGYPGIETQMLVWLEGRLDLAMLQTAVARLCRHHPVVASRLVDPCDGQSRPYWQFHPGNTCMLRETTLLSDDSQAVLDEAAGVLSDGCDPAEGAPLEFHLLHRPGGKDVLVLQYNHVLMDNRMAVPLLRELDRLSTSEDAPPEPSWRDHVLDHWRRFPREKRRKCLRAAIELQAYSLRGHAATLIRPGEVPSGRAHLHIVARTLTSAQTARLRAQASSLCGYPCVSMALLGCAFRAIDAMGPVGDDRQRFTAGIGIPLPSNVPDSLIFQNLTSALPMRIQRQDLHDRDQTVRLLSDQLRHRLAAGVDLGALGTTALFGRRRNHMDWVVWHLIRRSYSLWYGYFGALDAAGETFCRTRIEDLFHAGGPIWLAIGLTLLVSQYRGQTHLQATYDPRLVPRPLAESVLDFIVADLPC